MNMTAAASFGQSIDVWKKFPPSSKTNEDDADKPTKQHVSMIAVDPYDTDSKKRSQISWACEINGNNGLLGLCDSENHKFILWRTRDTSLTTITIGEDTASSGTSNTTTNKSMSSSSVSLAPLGNPVGAFQSSVDGLIYIACFGTFPNQQNDSGVAIVEIIYTTALQLEPRLVQTYPYPQPHHVHNIYEFDVLSNKNSTSTNSEGDDTAAEEKEIFLAILGNPWMDPPVPGEGLVRFDRTTGAFIPMNTTGNANANNASSAAVGWNVRSATQVSAGVYYALTQEPEGSPTKLVRMEQQQQQRTSSEAPEQHDELLVTAETILPPRDGGDGGADVLLGLEPNTVWVSDRWKGPGRLYYYSFDQNDTSNTTSHSSGDACSSFELLATHVATGVNARYTNMTTNGDIVVCSEDSGTLTVMQGLALNPMMHTSQHNTTTTRTTIPTVDTVQFFLESDSLIPFLDSESTTTSSSSSSDATVGGGTHNLMAAGSPSMLFGFVTLCMILLR